jgi:hypothetical protein
LLDVLFLFQPLQWPMYLSSTLFFFLPIHPSIHPATLT